MAKQTTPSLPFPNSIRVPGEYRLDENEIFSNDGERIICTVCGKTKYDKEYSRIIKGYWWRIHDRDGCDCMKEISLQKRLRRDDFDNPKFRAKENGELEKPLKKVRERRNFSWLYNSQYWMLESVPEWGRIATITDRFYMQNYKDAFNDIRSMLLMIDLAGMCKDSMFIQGSKGSFKTSLLCCFRFRLISNSIPVIMLNMLNLIKALRTDEKHKDEIMDVDVLIIDDLGKATLNIDQSRAFEDLLDYRARCDKPTLFASSVGYRELLDKGYSSELVSLIKRQISDIFFIDLDQREPSQENIEF